MITAPVGGMRERVFALAQFADSMETWWDVRMRARRGSG
jgi:hypothetical protein